MEKAPRITAFSTALFSTWVFVEDWKLLLDAGDGAAMGLLGKARKIKSIAITHPDRDHVMGLFQLNHHNSESIEKLYYPADSGSFPAVRDFLEKFDPETADKFDWQPVRPGESFPIGTELHLEVLENSHMSVNADVVKSVGYAVFRQKQLLRPEYKSLSQTELVALRKKREDKDLFDFKKKLLLGYSGDTKVENPSRWAGLETLFHEATFLAKDRDAVQDRLGVHSVLEDVLEMASAASPGRLVLYHFSTRYGRDEIEATVQAESRRLGIKFPIFVIEPGLVVRDLFAGAPVWEG